MRKDLKESAEGSDEYRIKSAVCNTSWKDIKSPSDHLSDSKADADHAVEEADFP